MDHFAKPEDELAIALREKKLYRNFQGYSTHAGHRSLCNGSNRYKSIENVYAQNFKTEKEYFNAINNEILPVVKGYHLNGR